MKPWSCVQWLLSFLRFQASVSRLEFLKPCWSAGFFSPGSFDGGLRSLAEAKSLRH